MLIYSISLSWLTRYNTYHRNWCPATTTYRTLAPCYKSIEDSKDFGTLTAARYKPVYSCDRKLAHLYRQNCGEPAISLHLHTVPMVQWSTHLLPVMRGLGTIPWGVLVWNGDSPVSVVSLHCWPWRDWSLWSRLRRASSRTVTRPSCQQCDNPTWSHTALLSWFHVRCRSSFWLHNQHSRLLGGGGALWRGCNLTAFTHSFTGPVVHPFASLHEEPRFNPRGGTYVKPGFSC